MISETSQSQAQIFCARWLPTLFHNTPEQFLTLLNRDGNKFLRFYWERAGKDLPASQLSDSFGLNYTFRTPTQNTLITLVTLPEPKTSGETRYMALIYRPNRRILLVSDTTKVIALEQIEPTEQGQTTRLIEISHRLEREELRGESVPPRLEDFYQAALKQLD